MADSIRNRLSLTAGLLALGLVSAAQAGDATPEMLANACAGCHGTEGNSMGPAAPSISAMDPLVFVDTMEAFKSGDTYSTVMGRIAKGYDTAEFEAMAEYFHAQPYRPAPQDYDAALVDTGAQLHDRFCEKCHAEGGIPLVDEEDYNILAGQWMPYLRYAMEDFRADRRELPKKMRSKLEDMLEHHGEDGLEALYAFYASQQ
ncbi:c-type cytochrome [Marichromatium gracile]|uniref:Sulfide dehydrogenase n=1 Tax=Marichromatium gracile TaxID=1048 RepID=A0ABR5VDU1_MARGR|nr:sulfide dehydrogenase [Marichromatium gracile]KXX63451.1 sulfide dehydrogenase [Marichromatium gracile]